MLLIENLEYRRRPRRKDLGLRVPANGRFYRLPHDMELYGVTRQRAGGYEQPNAVIPATRRFIKREPDYPDFMELSDAWCWRWVDMIHWASDYTITYQEACKVWRKLIERHTAFTDGYSPEEGYRDPVTGENEDKPNIHWGNIGMTGNIVKRLEDGRIEAFDMLKPPPPLDEIISQSWKWHWATEQRPEGTISNFPHIESVCGFPCGVPVPLVSEGGYLIMKPEYLQRVENGITYDAYR